MTRALKVLALSMMVSPAALACGMYIPEEINLAEVFDTIDAPTPAPEIAAAEQVTPGNISKIDNVGLTPNGSPVGGLIDLLKAVAPRS